MVWFLYDNSRHHERIKCHITEFAFHQNFESWSIGLAMKQYNNFLFCLFSLTDTDELWDNTWPVRTAHKHPETWLVIYTWDVSVLFLYAVYVNEPDCYWKRLIHLQELPLHCSYILFLVLTHFIPVFLFHNPWKNQKTRGFLFSGGIKKEYRPEIS